MLGALFHAFNFFQTAIPEWKKLPATAIEGWLYKWQRGWVSVWSRWGHRWAFWWWRTGEEQGEWGYLHEGVSGNCGICSVIFLEDIKSGILGNLGIGIIPVGPLVWLCCLEYSYEFWELQRWDRIWLGSEWTRGAQGGWIKWGQAASTSSFLGSWRTNLEAWFLVPPLCYLAMCILIARHLP